MTSDPKLLPNRLSKIDESNRRDHRLLRPEDRCAYFGEYTARRLAQYSDTNQFIRNFKKGLDRRGRDEWKYKESAIKEASEAMTRAVRPGTPGGLIFVPVPPSKMRDDPLYDDRMLRALTGFANKVEQSKGFRPLVCEIVRQGWGTEPMHLSNTARRVEDLLDVYEFDDEEVRRIGASRRFVICDDMLTTGCHYRAMVAKISGRFLDAEFWGIFFSRRVPESHDVEDL